jgi:transcriptional regulator GlxA family with amidase domain
MKHLSIIVPVGNVILDTIVGTLGLFKMANAHLKRIGKTQEDKFKIDLVGQSHEAVIYGGHFQVTPTKTIHEIKKTDLIIVSAISGDVERELNKNLAFVDWIKRQRIENGAEIASLCKGAFILAETGLLNGKSCATHWTVHDIFKKRYPQVNLIPEKIISEDSGIYSSGGAYSFLNFLLYLIEKYYGRETAIWCSKVSELDFDRSDQNQFIIFNGQKEHADEAIKDAQLFIEKHFEEKLNIETLARKFAISRRNFIRRFKKATFNTPLEYIQRVKVEAAKKGIESSTLNINQIMYNVGYNDEKAFRKVFKKYTGLSPLEYRRKYNREMAFS